MDKTTPLKLPRYMFRGANGSFRYKRNVPKDLRKVINAAHVPTDPSRDWPLTLAADRTAQDRS